MKNIIKKIKENSKKKKENDGQEIDAINQAIEKVTGQKTTEHHKSLIRSLIKFRHTTVKQIMVSRVDIVAIDYDSNYDEVLNIVSNQQYTRVPVFKDNIDKIEGILHIKTLFPYRNEPKEFAWQKLIQPVEFIPETKKIDELLHYFQQKRLHMAIAVDEYGGTAGLITLEDILEEIVGEIKDEFDDEELLYTKVNEHTYSFEAKILLVDFFKILNIDPETFNDVRGESESLGGLILELLSDFPKQGDKIEYKQYLFEVECVEKKRIKKIKVTLKENENKQD
ncbi:MAG: CBS domain-containing protein [Cytophagaceae bacterium]|nr:CBS domain-containing protein [Cytophagaceae bacterium]MDW8456227.1 transporter associated domain-containing protein [Cytophagaceae bacterium]